MGVCRSLRRGLGRSLILVLVLVGDLSRVLIIVPAEVLLMVAVFLAGSMGLGFIMAPKITVAVIPGRVRPVTALRIMARRVMGIVQVAR
ncbi:hypothetical protein SNQ18_06165 [Cutibacterium avidum]|uniref:hypothetical protein n=1 Tax=Cutibacterium avidum TaxID=33010 RepID=UPI002A5A1682|nr:hypothetical protein [Cutibacterium avidum]MDY0759529.1 hypothetical protein [Cutibacterium avidum]